MSTIGDLIPGEATLTVRYTKPQKVSKIMIGIMSTSCYAARTDRTLNFWGWIMIAAAVVDQVRRLLSDGKLSQRKIAGALGISRGTVNAIALGRRTERLPKRCDEGFTPPTGRQVRCGECGGMVQMPCLACYLRQRGTTRGRTMPRRGRSPNCGTIAAVSVG